jgi:ABC-type sugar transport system ATPase subunit
MFDCRLTPTGFAGPIRYPSLPPLADAAATADSSAVTLGVRPDAVELRSIGDRQLTPVGDASDAPAGATDDDSTPAETVFSGEVSVIEPVGGQSFLYVELASGADLIVADEGATLPREGTAVQVHVPPRRIHLFDGTTGEALRHPDHGDVTDDYPSRVDTPSGGG